MNLAEIESIDGVLVERGKDLTKFSTMQLVAKGDLVTVSSVDALVKTIQAFSKSNQQYWILGLGANQLLPEATDRPYLKLKFPFDKSYLNDFRESYVLPGSLNIATLTAHAAKFGVKGWEVFTGIPATLGGAVFMNAGTNLGEIGSLVMSVGVIDHTGEKKKIVIDEKSFTYRKNHFLSPGDIVYEVELESQGKDPNIGRVIKEYLEKRNKTQPMKEKTCGCIFKNLKRQTENGEETCRAGQSIDIIGLKGFQYKNLRVSPVHANFMENLGGATATEVKEFIELINDKVEEKYGFRFEPEVRFLENE